MVTSKELKASEKQKLYKMIEASESFKKWKAMRKSQESAGKLSPPKLGYIHAYLTDISKKATLDFEKWKKKINVADIETVDYPQIKQSYVKRAKEKEIPLEKISVAFKKPEAKIPEIGVISFIIEKEGKKPVEEELSPSEVTLKTLSQCKKIEFVDMKNKTHTLPKLTQDKLKSFKTGIDKGFVKSIKCIMT